MGKALTDSPRSTYRQLVHFQFSGNLPLDGETPQPMIKGDGSDLPIAFTQTKVFIDGQEVKGAAFAAIGNEENQIPDVADAVGESGATIHARLDYPPLNADTPGALITGTLTSDGTTPISMPIFVPETSPDLYYTPEGGGVEIYSLGTPGVDEWEVYFYASGVYWTSTPGDDLETASWTPGGSNTGTPSIALITRPKTRAHNCVANGATYENRGTLDAPDWHVVPTVESVASQISVLAEKRLNSVAYVSPTYGSNVTARLGAINRPYQSVAAAIAASSKVCLLESASWAGGTPSATHLEIFLTAGATLTQTGTLTPSAGKKVSITGHGNLFFNPATDIQWRAGGAGSYVVVNIEGDMTTNSLVMWAVYASYNIPTRINCRRFFAQRSTLGANGLFTVFNNSVPTIFFGPNIKFHSAGVALFAVGGPTDNPKIHFGANCLVWTNGPYIFGDCGSNGHIYANGFVGNAAFVLGPPNSGVGVVGDNVVVPVGWLSEEVFLQL